MEAAQVAPLPYATDASVPLMACAFEPASPPQRLVIDRNAAYAKRGQISGGDCEASDPA